jgi:GAF domain-containing protein
MTLQSPPRMIEQDLREDTEVNAAIQRILDELRRSVPYDSASVQQLRGDRLVIVGGVGFAHLDVILGEAFELNSGDTPNGEVIFRRQPKIVADTDKFRAFRRGLHVGAGIRSWLGVPLIDGDDVLGMITLDKQEPDFYTAEHQRLVASYAKRIASALAGS